MPDAHRAAALAQQIEAAFRDVPMPAPQSFGWVNLDERWCSERFANRLRNQVEIEDNMTECLGIWMPLAAIHYFLPAFLIHYLQPEEADNPWVVTAMKGYFDHRKTSEFPAFDGPQRQAIIAWLDYIRDHMTDHDETGVSRQYRQLGVIRDQWAVS